MYENRVPKRDEVTGNRDEMKKKEIGGACGTCGGEENCIQGLRGET